MRIQYTWNGLYPTVSTHIISTTQANFRPSKGTPHSLFVMKKKLAFFAVIARFMLCAFKLPQCAVEMTVTLY